jgi:small neutral amino acid transporter SnatA (MarC family)
MMLHFSSYISNKLNSHGSRITAAVLGSLITTVALTVCITLIWPFGDLIEQIFAGGTFFFVFWASLFYWAILAEGGKKAWLRILALFFPVLAIDIISLTFK